MEEMLVLALNEMTKDEIIEFVVGTSTSEGIKRLADTAKDKSDAFKKAIVAYGFIKITEPRS